MPARPQRVSQYQAVSSKTMNVSNIKRIQQVLLILLHACICVTAASKKKKDREWRVRGGSGAS